MRLTPVMRLTSTSMISTATNKSTFNVAIVGGGITGSCAASVLMSMNERRLFQNTNNNNNSDNETAKNDRPVIEPTLSSLLNQNNKNDNDDDDFKELSDFMIRGGGENNMNIQVNVDLFDQGRSGVGGRTSHRRRRGNEKDGGISRDEDEFSMRWDHGCQFFRADTPQFKNVVSNWMTTDFNLVSEWNGKFCSNTKNAESDFFGLPSQPPFYVGTDGMQSISKGLLHHLQQLNTNISNGEDDVVDDNSDNEPILNIFTGTRVAEMIRDEDTNKWFLNGVDGTPAYHDTPESKVKELNAKNNRIGSRRSQRDGYDAVILTDVSSSFGKWHRASAGIPEDFASCVRERVGARVPLFTAMIAFDRESGVPFDAASFEFENNKTLWFAAKMNSKPMHGMLDRECWTLVSTPEYAIKKIEETPMQTESGEFIPQSKEYLTSVPGPDLEKAFREEVTSQVGILGDNALDAEEMPSAIFIDAQRWGSAMPCHRHLDDKSKTRKMISGVNYDSGRAPLAPTKFEKQNCVIGTESTFLSDDSLMLFQAGDMMSSYTPGFESAALSGMDAAKSALITLCQKHQMI